MNFPEPGFYHIYNRGNNKELIFFESGDYLHFIKLSQIFVSPRCQILAWCLMPNHFHFLVDVNKASLEPVKWGGNIMPSISNGFQLLQSNYSKKINNRQNMTGSLFQQKTKSKLLVNQGQMYTAFLYLHQIPVKALLTKSMLEWEYSSYKEYCGLEDDCLSSVNWGKNTLNLSEIDFRKEPVNLLSEDEIGKIF